MGKRSFRWITFLSGRYLMGRERENRNITQLLSVLGLAVGVMTLITVISIMNGLQLGYISDILEIGSYHMRIDYDGKDPSIPEKVSEVRGIRSCVPFTDIQVLSEGSLSRLAPINVRCVDPAAAAEDRLFMEHLNIIRGKFSLENGDGVVLGSELARYLRLEPGDTFSVMALAGESFNKLKPQNIPFRVTGIFKSGYYEYDRNLVIMSLESAPLLQAGTPDIKLGVKLSNQYRDKRAEKRLREVTDGKIVSWREYNKAFFGALRMEKFAMMFVISLIFVVIGVNIFNFMKRSVSEKMEDIAILYSIGVSEREVRKIFVTEGIMTGLAGGVQGVVLGMLVASNVNAIFDFVGSIASGFQLFPRSYFYIMEIPVKIMPGEVLAAFLFAFLSSVFSALAAVRRLDVKNPASVLRCE